MENDFILIGKISGAHGLKGGLNVYSFAEDISVFEPGSVIYMKDKGADGFELFETISVSKKKQNILLLIVDGIDGRDKAEKLKGFELYVKKKALPKTEEDSWYWHDLIGMDVCDIDGCELGTVDNLMRTGSSDILEVKNNEKEILIPFLKDIIISVSIEDSLIIVDLPEGLADL